MTNALDKSNIVPIVTAERVEIFYAQNDKWTTKDKKNDFVLTFKRISTLELTKLFVRTSPMLCWIVVGVLILATFGMVAVAKKFCTGEVGKDLQD